MSRFVARLVLIATTVLLWAYVFAAVIIFMFAIWSTITAIAYSANAVPLSVLLNNHTAFGTAWLPWFFWIWFVIVTAICFGLRWVKKKVEKYVE